MVLIRRQGEPTDTVVENTREINNLKTTQRIAADSIREYHYRVNQNSDLAVNISPWQTKRYRIRFTGSKPDMRHIIHCSAFMRVGNSNVLAAPQSNYYPTAPEVSFAIKKRAVKQPNVHDWVMRVDHNIDTGPVTAYFKFLFNGSDTGSFTITEI